MKVGNNIYCIKSWGTDHGYEITKGRYYRIKELYNESNPLPYFADFKLAIYIICDNGAKLLIVLDIKRRGLLYYYDYFSDRKLKLEKLNLIEND